MSVNDGLSDEEWGAWGKSETIEVHNSDQNQNGFGGIEEPNVSSLPETSRFSSNGNNSRSKFSNDKEQNGGRFTDKRNGYSNNNDSSSRFTAKRDNEMSNGFKRDNDLKRDDNDQKINRFRNDDDGQKTNRFRSDDNNQKTNRFRNDDNDQNTNRFRNDNDQKSNRFRNDDNEKTNRFRNDDNDQTNRFRSGYDSRGSDRDQLDKGGRSKDKRDRINGHMEEDYRSSEHNNKYKKRDDSKENRRTNNTRKDVYNRDDSLNRNDYKRDSSRDNRNGTYRIDRNDNSKRRDSRENRDNYRKREDSRERTRDNRRGDSSSRNRYDNSRERNDNTRKRFTRDDSYESDRRVSPRRRNNSRDSDRISYRRDNSRDRKTHLNSKRVDSRDRKIDYRSNRDDSRDRKIDYRSKRDDSRDRKNDFRHSRDDSRDRKPDYRQSRDDSRDRKHDSRMNRDDDFRDKRSDYKPKREDSRDRKTDARQKCDDSRNNHGRNYSPGECRDNTSRKYSPKRQQYLSDSDDNKRSTYNKRDTNRDDEDLRNKFDRQINVNDDNDNDRFKSRTFTRPSNDKPTDNENRSGGDGDGAPTAVKRITFIPDDDLADYALHVNSGINFDNYDKIPVEVTGEDAPAAIAKFSEINDVPDFLMKNINELNYKKLTPVQKYAIPIISGRRDLMACAQTGSGKTVAFLTPIITDLIRCEKESEEVITNNQVAFPKALILAPTRELCRQIYTAAKQLCGGSNIRCSYLYGGIEMNKSRRNMHASGGGCDILVATPGRLIHFLELVWVSLRSLRFFVLDEADRMLEAEGFFETVSKIYRECNIACDESRTIQISMFSATFPHEIQELARTLLRIDYLFLAVGVVGAASSDVRQEIVLAEQSRDKITAAIDYIKTVPEEKTLVFVDTKRMADFLGIKLGFLGFKTTTIHGDREQEQREQALNDFKSGRVNLMVATNVAARGLDIPLVDNVINLDLPSDIDTYVHRIGRTGRCGNVGRAISYFDESKDIGLASGLVAKLQESNQEVADWLRSLSDSSGGCSGRGQRQNNYSNRDTRRDVASSRFVDTPSKSGFMQGSNLDYDDTNKPDTEWLED